MATPNANQAPQGSPNMPPGSGKATRALQGRWGWQKLRRASFLALVFRLGVPWIINANGKPLALAGNYIPAP